METPHDTGIAYVTAGGDGRVTVLVCSYIDGNRPGGIIAMHRNARSLVVRTGVTMTSDGNSQRSQGNVIVFGDGAGAVHIMPPNAEEKLVARGGVIAAAPPTE